MCKGIENCQFIENIRVMLRALHIEGNESFIKKILK